MAKVIIIYDDNSSAVWDLDLETTYEVSNKLYAIEPENDVFGVGQVKIYIPEN